VLNGDGWPSAAARRDRSRDDERERVPDGMVVRTTKEGFYGQIRRLVTSMMPKEKREGGWDSQSEDEGSDTTLSGPGGRRRRTEQRKRVGARCSDLNEIKDLQNKKVGFDILVYW
jgi:hypothetical protein